MAIASTLLAISVFTWMAVMAGFPIVIVNYKSAQLVIDCLHSLVPEVAGEPGYRVIVVENASGDDSTERVRKAIAEQGWHDWAEVLPLTTNLGFAGGNNAALRRILEHQPLPEYILLLNPDTVVRPGALAALREFLDTHPRVGIAGSRLEDPDGTPQRSAFRFPSVLSELENGLRLGVVSRLLERWLVAPPVQEIAHPTDWVAGASMLVRREVFDAIGLMEADYFLDFEETDFCLRARRAGWPTWYVPASRVVHLVGQSSGVTNITQRARRMPRYWFESRRRYFQKNYSSLTADLADLAWSISFALWRIRRKLQRKPDVDPPQLLLDFVRFTYGPGERSSSKGRAPLTTPRLARG